jgi:hypothetical protein
MLSYVRIAEFYAFWKLIPASLYSVDTLCLGEKINRPRDALESDRIESLTLDSSIFAKAGWIQTKGK